MHIFRNAISEKIELNFGIKKVFQFDSEVKLFNFHEISSIAADRRALLEPWAQKAGKLAEEARKIRNGCGNAKAVETELLEWTRTEGWFFWRKQCAGS